MLAITPTRGWPADFCRWPADGQAVAGPALSMEALQKKSKNPSRAYRVAHRGRSAAHLSGDAEPLGPHPALLSVRMAVMAGRDAVSQGSEQGVCARGNRLLLNG